MMNIQYPYLPEGRTIKYVPLTNEFMARAKEVSRLYSLDKVMPGGAVVVKDNIIIGEDANGSDYHETHECERVKQGCASGQGYELCEGCHPDNHSERSAIIDARAQGNDPKDADLYLWGHWWCCEPCWTAMIEAGIRDVYLLEGSEKLFDKNHPENIVGKQFEV